jgi:hypothetical protein
MPTAAVTGIGSHWQANHQALYRIISNEVFSRLDAREENIARLATRSDWETYQDQIKMTLCGTAAKFPASPLNPRITGTIERPGFVVEKVLFESHPGFYVTACLFIPGERQTPAPAVIYCSGHTELGFRSDAYQQVILNLVAKGFIVFAFDPIGQGERLQYPDPETGKSKAGGPTIEHSLAGMQTLLTGTALTDYFIWDGIRAVDYLATRSEVDMQRIGITGRSGGGTQSAMIGACDGRILAAAPENYITSFRRLFQSIGPQDAEQNPWQAIARGFDHADYLHARAPRPTLVLATTNDIFSIQGVRETFREAMASYVAMGHPQNLRLTEDMGGHESTRRNREAVYAFFREHLALPGDTTDTAVELFKPEELWVTPTGQVQTSYGGETIYSLNRKYFRKEALPEAEKINRALALSGMSFHRRLTASVYTGKFLTDGLEVRKYFLENHTGDYALPLYVVRNAGVAAGKTLLWLHPGGKEKVPGNPMLAALAGAGYVIVVPDLPGTGELNDPGFTGDAMVGKVPFNYTFGANLAGKSIPGIQAEAIDLVVQFLETGPIFRDHEIFAIAEGDASSPLLHYTLQKNPFAKVVLTGYPGPAEALVHQEIYDPVQAFNVVPGSLPVYTTDDLIRLLPSRSVKVLSGEGGKGSEGDMVDILNFIGN